MVVKWDSKTTWTGIALIGFGVSQIVSSNIEQGIQSILNGLAFIFLRTAIDANK